MIKIVRICGAVILLLKCYAVINFFFFDWWAGYSSQKQINTYIKNNDTYQLHRITTDKKTYNFLLNEESVLIKLQADNQGSGDLG